MDSNNILSSLYLRLLSQALKEKEASENPKQLEFAFNSADAEFLRQLGVKWGKQ